jgi:hypothetical protein
VSGVAKLALGFFIAMALTFAVVCELTDDDSSNMREPTGLEFGR